MPQNLGPLCRVKCLALRSQDLKRLQSGQHGKDWNLGLASCWRSTLHVALTDWLQNLTSHCRLCNDHLVWQPQPEWWALIIHFLQEPSVAQHLTSALASSVAPWEYSWSCCTFHKWGRHDSGPHVPWLGGLLQESSAITTGLLLLPKEAAPSLSSSSSIGDLTQKTKLCPLRNLEQVRDLDGRGDRFCRQTPHPDPTRRAEEWLVSSTKGPRADTFCCLLFNSFIEV